MLLSRASLRRGSVTVCRHFFGRSFTEKRSTSGLFGNELLKSAAGFRELNAAVRVNCDAIVREIENGRPDRTTIQLMDDLSNEICKAADLVECVRQLHSDERITSAAEESARDFCQLVESLNTYTVIYEKLKSSKQSEASRLDNVDLRTIDLFLDDFEQSGVHLPADKRDDFVSLSGDVFDASARFQWGCDREVEINRSEKNKYGLSSSIISSPITHSMDSVNRRFVHNVYYKHSDEQENLLRQMISGRDSLARLTGYESFAHRAQYNTLLGTYENARDFLWGLVEACRPSAERELAVLMDVQGQCEAGSSKIGEWDIHFLTHLYKERAFGHSHHRAVGKFLTLGNLMRGFMELCDKLYGIRFEEQTPASGECWPGTVIKLAAIDTSNNVMGHIYMDVDRRGSKAVGDCHYTVRCSKQLASDEWQTPIVVLSLSLTDTVRKDWESISVGIHSAENLFHELGHAMHSMLGRTKYQHVAGTRCPQDFSEIPSNLMEYFFNDLVVMRGVLRTAEGESVAVEDAACLISSRFAFSSLETVQQAIYALFDLELHGSDAQRFAEGKMTSTQLFHSIATTALPHLERSPDAAFQHRFHHLVQYGARYYSYLVARSAASLIWNTHFASNPFDRLKGLQWAEVQSHGGGLPSAVLLKSILGYSPSPDHLVRALAEETGNSSRLGAVSV